MYDDDELEQQDDDLELPERKDWPGLLPKQSAFLYALVHTGGQVVAAAKAARMSRSTHYEWLANDAAYAAAHKRAMEQAADVLESEAITRAKQGVREPVYFRGERCGYVMRYSDGLMQFLLRGARPEKYAREKVEHTGKDGGPIAVRTDPAISNLTDDELNTALQLAEKLARPESGTGTTPA